MFLKLCAYLALSICLAGVFHRGLRWFTLRIGPEAEGAGFLDRFKAGAKAFGAMIVNPRRLGSVLWTLLFEVLLQVHILKQNTWRWLTHMALFYGILLLVVLHALDNWITARIFSNYASTLNPFLFLRNLLGVLVVFGVATVVIRRRADGRPRSKKRASDRVALVLLSLLIVSGVVLEAFKIVSPSIFETMARDYMGDDPDEIAALKVYWAKDFGVAFEPPPPAGDNDLLASGQKLHQDYCASCHSKPQAAVLSYPLARALKPVAVRLDRLRPDLVFYYLHYLAACGALALLPFSKLFHLLSAPLSLLVRSGGDAASDLPINRPARRVLGLDACTHCGVCSLHCAVSPIYRVISNPLILPSEKTGALAAIAGGDISEAGCAAFSEGSFICTGCGRCTRFCPSGIDLQDLWQASRIDLKRTGFGSVHDWIRTRSAAEWAQIARARKAVVKPATALDRATVSLADNPESFSACVQCTTCTSVCPVVAASDDPKRDLDMTPQQVMNLLRLQLKDMALGCRMVWDCVTCYKCQEHCPQGVRVADILYELRNEACRRFTVIPKKGVKLPDA
jgi:heterodisulfide reductase subunit C/nitrate reductase gamma subunit